MKIATSVPRSKAFNQESALDEAVNLFWSKGYEATSMQDLVDAMGIQRGSLYATFGSKQALFLAALERYGEVVVTQLLQALQAHASPKASIQLFFTNVIEHIVTAGPLRSCLLTNSAVERGLSDADTRATVVHLLQRITDGFQATLIRAQSAGEVSDKQDVQALAEYLTGHLQGLLVIGKIRSQKPLLHSINRVALSVLEP